MVLLLLLLVLLLLVLLSDGTQRPPSKRGGEIIRQKLELRLRGLRGLVSEGSRSRR